MNGLLAWIRSDTPSMTTIECFRCGRSFETRATTATRCPSCRSVVHISRGTSSARPGSSTARSRVREHDSESSEPAGDADGVVLLLAALMVGGFVLYRLVRRWRKRTAEATELPGEPVSGPYTFPTTSPTSAPDGPGHDVVPPLATRPDAATQGHTAPGFGPAA